MRSKTLLHGLPQAALWSQKLNMKTGRLVLTLTREERHISVMKKSERNILNIIINEMKNETAVATKHWLALHM